MTVHIVLVDPPRPGLVLPRLSETTPLTDADAADLYGAMVRDTVVAAAESGGELLVNYRPDELLDPAHRTDRDTEAAVRELVRNALADPSAARFEVQVGSSYAARVGNAVTHLLRDEDATSVAVLDGLSPTLGRSDLDGAAMKLRRNDVLIGPAPGGRVSYLGLVDPIDFEGAYDPPELERLTARGVSADLDVGFLSMHPIVETGADLVTLVSLVQARRAAGRLYPTHTAECIDAKGLSVDEEAGKRRIERAG